MKGHPERTRRVRQRLLNGSVGDPALLVKLPLAGRTMLFDCGFCPSLGRDDYRALDDLFVSHTHLDHFVGFDAILRMNYGEDRTIEVYGPGGIIDQVRNKLHGYTWNLKTEKKLTFRVTEVTPERFRRQELHSLDWFAGGELEEWPAPDEPILDLVETNEYRVATAILDHKTPCLAFTLVEADRFNLDKEAMRRLGLRDGPWCGELKRRVLVEGTTDGEIDVWGVRWKAAELASALVVRTPGYKLAYVTDIAPTAQNRERAVALAWKADRLYCEAFYLSRDAAFGLQNAHLTAKQAGELARDAEVGQLVLMHFSKRYGEGLHPRLLREARSVFPRTVAYFSGAHRV